MMSENMYACVLNLMVNHSWHTVVIMLDFIDSSNKVNKICLVTLLLLVILLSLRYYLMIASYKYGDSAVVLEPIVRKLCQDKKSNFEILKPVGRFSIQPHTGLLMCRTAKHGSTSLASIFLKIYER